MYTLVAYMKKDYLFCSGENRKPSAVSNRNINESLNSVGFSGHLGLT